METRWVLSLGFIKKKLFVQYDGGEETFIVPWLAWTLAVILGLIGLVAAADAMGIATLFAIIEAVVIFAVVLFGSILMGWSIASIYRYYEFKASQRKQYSSSYVDKIRN